MGNSKEKIEWTSKLIMRLIKEAEERPCLWCKTDSQYSNKIYKTIAYDEIGELLGVPGEAVRTKLRNLRINFMQVYKKQVKASQASKRVYPPKWEYYDALLFMADTCDSGNGSSMNVTPAKRIKPKIEYEESTTSFDPLSDEVSRTDEMNEIEELKEDEFNRLEESNQTSMYNISQDLNDAEDCNRRIKNKTIHKVRPQVQSSVNKGSNEVFGEYVTASLNCIEDANIVKRMKAKIQILISEVMTEHATLKLSECDSSAEC